MLVVLGAQVCCIIEVAHKILEMCRPGRPCRYRELIAVASSIDFHGLHSNKCIKERAAYSNTVCRVESAGIRSIETAFEVRATERVLVKV